MYKKLREHAFVETLRAWCLRHGYTLDKFGHYVKGTGEGARRVKLQDKSFRIEVRAKIGDGMEWVRTRSGFYGKVAINAEDQLTGLVR